YETFREEALDQRVTLYEQLCASFGNLFHVTAKPVEMQKLQDSITASHLFITPQQAMGFGTFFALSLIFIGVLIGSISFVFDVFGDYVFLMLLFVVGGALLLKPMTQLPHYFAQRWRLAASNQMVMSILYMVIYMRHTSNLEHAIKFAGEHVGMPLSLDFKKILWDVETGRYVTIQDSLESYLRQWKDYNLEFVESIHLIQGSLYEAQEAKRLDMLEKSLQVILDGTYDRMLHYAHTLKSPLTILHMLGVILPILGLVIFPLLGSFLGGLIRWYHLAFLYNLVLPLLVFFLGYRLLSQRPTGYGKGELLKQYTLLQERQNALGNNSIVNPLFIGGMITTVFLLLAFLPFFVHWIYPTYDFELMGWKFLDYKGDYGPYGFWSLLISLLLPVGFGLGIGMYYWLKTRNLIEITRKTDLLEKEFSGGLFQLGSRIGSGIPVEAAFGSVAENMKGTPTGDFFARVNNNIRNAGVGLKQALFDTQIGAVFVYPSNFIESSMKVLVESAKKGPTVVSRSLVTISQYMERIGQVNERLKDLMADVLSSMTSQITFLTPIIAGIVVGVGSIVVTIINLLGEQFQNAGLEEGGFTGGISAIASVLNIQDVIPGYQFQAVVGLYVVELTILLTILSTAIERGVDDTTTRYRIAQNLFRGVSFYVVIALIGIIVFNLLASAVGTVGV
ncbi:MAG: hypothetical protein AABX72_02925, partial [Nanoarchaeota archaeon]